MAVEIAVRQSAKSIEQFERYRLRNERVSHHPRGRGAVLRFPLIQSVTRSSLAEELNHTPLTQQNYTTVTYVVVVQPLVQVVVRVYIPPIRCPLWRHFLYPL